jgi:hypothetical protein
MRTLTLALLLGLGFLPAVSRLIADDKPNDATLGAKAPEGAAVLFDGKSLDGWVKTDGKTPADWPLADGIMTVGHGSIMTARRMGDIQLHLEFNVPYMPDAHGQARGNSGVYLAGCYEVQILDSYGLKPRDNECAAVYTQATPRVNACKPPLQWQTYDITFRRAQVEDGKVVRKARITVVFNGVNVIDNAEVGTNGGGMGTGPGDEGPLMLQDHGNAVQFRNIWARPL